MFASVNGSLKVLGKKDLIPYVVKISRSSSSSGKDSDIVTHYFLGPALHRLLYNRFESG